MSEAADKMLAGKQLAADYASRLDRASTSGDWAHVGAGSIGGARAKKTA